MRELLLHLIADNKELQKQIKDILLEQNTLIVDELHGDTTALLLLNDSQANTSTHTSIEEPKELVKLI